MSQGSFILLSCIFFSFHSFFAEGQETFSLKAELDSLKNRYVSYAGSLSYAQTIKLAYFYRKTLQWDKATEVYQFFLDELRKVALSKDVLTHDGPVLAASTWLLKESVWRLWGSAYKNLFFTELQRGYIEQVQVVLLAFKEDLSFYQNQLLAYQAFFWLSNAKKSSFVNQSQFQAIYKEIEEIEQSILLLEMYFYSLESENHEVLEEYVKQFFKKHPQVYINSSVLWGLAQLFKDSNLKKAKQYQDFLLKERSSSLEAWILSMVEQKKPKGQFRLSLLDLLGSSIKS